MDDKFEWLAPAEAEEQFQRKQAEFSPRPDMIDLSEIESRVPAEDDETLTGRQYEPRRNVSRFINEVREHLIQLWVVGASRLTDEELQQLGPYLAREESYREDAVFQILSRRRQDVPEYLRPYVTVQKEHMLQFGLAAQAGRISLENIQVNNTTSAATTLEPLLKSEELEAALVASNLQRRILRTLHNILIEPTESTANFFDRLKRQATEEDGLRLEELVARTYLFTQTQLEKHLREHPNTLETEETLVAYLEEGRLQRLKNLGKVVLVAGLGVIAAEEYKGEDYQ